MSDNENAQAENTDRELWREREGDYYAPSIFVTKYGAIGIDVGGHVIVQTVERWHECAALRTRLAEALAENERLRTSQTDAFLWGMKHASHIASHAHSFMSSGKVCSTAIDERIVELRQDGADSQVQLFARAALGPALDTVLEAVEARKASVLHFKFSGMPTKASDAYLLAMLRALRAEQSAETEGGS